MNDESSQAANSAPEPASDDLKHDELRAAVHYYEQQADAAAGYFIRSDAELSLTRRDLKQKNLAFTILSELQEAIHIDAHADLAEVFETTLAHIHETLKVDRSMVLLRKPDQPGFFEIKHHLGLADHVIARLGMLFFQFTETEMAGSEYLMVNRETEATPFISLLRDMLGLKFFALVPMKADGEVFGYLLSASDKEAYPFFPPFDATRYETFSAIAGFLSASYVNFTLYNDLRKAKQSLEEYNGVLEEKVREATEDLRKRNRQLEKEKERSESLLLNLLPKETADELRRTGQAVPRNFDQVSVIFGDIVGFSEIAKEMDANALVSELDTIFRAFDHIVDRNGLEKLKTIGDCYMCAGGLPAHDDLNAVHAVRACFEFVRYLTERKQEQERLGKPFFEMRFGIHTGPVVAGVVGSRKFAYDIWGNTVNVAARIEQAGEVGRVNISESTYNEVVNHFRCIQRGPVTVKHGIPIEMYFVENDVDGSSLPLN